ncbi:LytTR family DNA-binding domain-containing protein [Brevundimonas sp. R86498]|uniref:LytTR family DNA-binding domain-containing protein n=1 Tax=Brevundimonas sp. R86498 TaxID=3093845 RepID=UPI0037C70306
MAGTLRMRLAATKAERGPRMTLTPMAGVDRPWVLKAHRDAGPLLLGLAVLFAGYLTAFATTLDQPLITSIGFAAINTLSLSVPALVFRPIVYRLAVSSRSALAILVHPLLAAAFSVIWYFCSLAGFALSPNWPTEGFSVTPFGPVALSWQLFQGVTVYGVLALFVYWRNAVGDSKPVEGLSPPSGVVPRVPRVSSTSLMVRCDKEMVPVLMSDLLRIAGVDGYSEIVTTARSILSTTSLSRFDEILPQDQFVRAHRSYIVRIGAIVHVEPAGNARLLLQMSDGTSIMTSRAGARRLRELAV